MGFIENLQSRLRQRDGELRSAQSAVAEGERANKALAEELAATISRNESLAAASSKSSAVEHELSQLQIRYAASLEMLGEKEEALNEALLDVEDVKGLYRDIVLAKLEPVAGSEQQQQQQQQPTASAPPHEEEGLTSWVSGLLG